MFASLKSLLFPESLLFPDSSDDRVILEIDLDRGVLSALPDNPFAALRSMNAPTMKALRDGLRDAAEDAKVRGLLVHVGACPLTPAQLDELGDLVEQFGTAKPTLAWSESFGELGNALLAYRFATRAQQVWVQPSGVLGLFGTHLDITLLRGGLEKLGLDPQMSQRKEYKSAAEQFAAHEVSEPNREMMQAIADSVVHRSVDVIARRRGLSADEVWDAVNHAPLTAQEALDRRLVDHVGYRDEVYAAARETWDVPAPERRADDGLLPALRPRKHDDGLRFVHRHNGKGPFAAFEQLTDRTKPAIAVVGVHGGITTGRGQQGGPGGSQAGSDVVCEHLRAAARDDKVKAVVLRVDSPGGSYVASDTIWRQVHQLRSQGLPVIASMGDVAASGGYYVAMGADEIVANPTTLTGSIGVFAGKFVTQGLFDKLGLVREGVNAGDRAAMMASNEGFTDEQWDVLNRWLDEVYADFTGKAAADRNLPIDELEPLARGRVWTGADAQERRLVDHLGGLDVALERACALAEIDRDAVVVRPVPVMPALERFRPAESSESVSGASSGWQRLLGGSLHTDLARSLGADGVLLMPWRIEIR